MLHYLFGEYWKVQTVTNPVNGERYQKKTIVYPWYSHIVTIVIYGTMLIGLPIASLAVRTIPESPIQSTR